MPRKKKIISIAEKMTEIKKEEFFFATGKRKSAIAQVKLKLQGEKEIIVNQKDYQKYFPFFAWQKIILDPFEATKLKNFKAVIKIKGGGVKSQAESIRLGIARALIKVNPEWRKILKPLGFLRRDPRIKERKKPGLKRARKAPQWAKR